MSDRSPRQPYRFGPIALFSRFKRWHLTAPLWQVLLLMTVLVGLIIIVRITQFTIPPW